MRITSLIENTSCCGLPVEHGLSLYIELDSMAKLKDNTTVDEIQSCNAITDNQNFKLKILFDMGQGDLFALNAEQLGISIENIDLAVISHGHYDHGGGLETFLKLNGKAPVYIHSKAFEPHYSLKEIKDAESSNPATSNNYRHFLKYIGLDTSLQENGRLAFCKDFEEIQISTTAETAIKDVAKNVSMLLFSGVKGNCCNPSGNRLLFEADKDSDNILAADGNVNLPNDTFAHEQNLLIKEGNNLVLFAGCAHAGIINIIRQATQIAGSAPTHVFAGMHLAKSKSATTITAKETATYSLSENKPATAGEEFINALAKELQAYTNTKYYTMHCTGIEAFQQLRQVMGNQIEYLSGGESINL